MLYKVCTTVGQKGSKLGNSWKKRKKAETIAKWYNEEHEEKNLTYDQKYAEEKCSFCH